MLRGDNACERPLKLAKCHDASQMIRKNRQKRKLLNRQVSKSESCSPCRILTEVKRFVKLYSMRTTVARRAGRRCRCPRAPLPGLSKSGIHCEEAREARLCFAPGPRGETRRKSSGPEWANGEHSCIPTGMQESVWPGRASIHVKLEELSRNSEDDPFADVGDPVGRPLQVMGSPEQVVAAVNQ